MDRTDLQVKVLTRTLPQLSWWQAVDILAHIGRWGRFPTTVLGRMIVERLWNMWHRNKFMKLMILYGECMSYTNIRIVLFQVVFCSFLFVWGFGFWLPRGILQNVMEFAISLGGFLLQSFCPGAGTWYCWWFRNPKQPPGIYKTL